MPITVTKLGIDGLLLIQPKVFGDSRGYFFESYNEMDLARAGLEARFVQDNQSFSRKATLRGLHYQVSHPQGKLIRVIDGRVFDVAVDMRPGSATRGMYQGVVLSGEENNQLFIPEGFAHGFLVLSETALVAYKSTDFYYPEDEGGIRWDDPDLDIDWPSRDVLVSQKDSALPYLRALPGFAG